MAAPHKAPPKRAISDEMKGNKVLETDASIEVSEIKPKTVCKPKERRTWKVKRVLSNRDLEFVRKTVQKALEEYYTKSGRHA